MPSFMNKKSWLIGFFLSLVLVSIVFIIANISLGLLVCSVKNQTASAFIAIGTILLPLFVITFSNMSSFPAILQLLLNALPLTPYILLFKFMAFNGVIIYSYLIMLFIQIIVYFPLVLIIMKKRTGK